jgi:hypothetical protein
LRRSLLYTRSLRTRRLAGISFCDVIRNAKNYAGERKKEQMPGII